MYRMGREPWRPCHAASRFIVSDPGQVVPDYSGITLPSSKRERVLENSAAGSINLSKEEFDEIIQLVEGLNVYGLRYNKARENTLWG